MLSIERVKKQDQKSNASKGHSRSTVEVGADITCANHDLDGRKMVSPQKARLKAAPTFCVNLK